MSASKRFVKAGKEIWKLLEIISIKIKIAEIPTKYKEIFSLFPFKRDII